MKRVTNVSLFLFATRQKAKTVSLYKKQQLHKTSEVKYIGRVCNANPYHSFGLIHVNHEVVVNKSLNNVKTLN